MKRIKSPLKQLDQQAQQQSTNQKGMMEAGMDILAENQRRKNWEDLQLEISMIEPDFMRDRKMKDKALREEQKNTFDGSGTFSLGPKYIKIYLHLVKQWQDELYEALKSDDKKTEQEIMLRLATMEQTVQVIKDNMQEFYDDHFSTESHLSKGVSAQQVSFGTQIYCKNPELEIVVAEARDIELGRIDYYGQLVKENSVYAVIDDFEGRVVLVNVIEGNKDCFIVNKLKALEYKSFLMETHRGAEKARQEKAAVKIDLGSINYKMDTFFGHNDGSASKEQDELVLQFAWDDGILEDGSTFRRHLYEHPNIENLNYGGFDWDTLQLNLPLGPGDVNYWQDNIDELDKMRLVDAICNQDSQYFNIKLLRTLVKEYYTIKLENAWWKGMGFEEGRIDVMRLKQRDLIKKRFKLEKAKAAAEGRKDFTFDGEIYPTGADLEKQKKEQDKIIEDSTPVDEVQRNLEQPQQ